MPFSGSITVSLQTELIVAGALREVRDPIARSIAVNFANGTGLNQATNIYDARRTLAGGANENLDVTGSLVNSLGASVALTKVKAVVLAALTTNPGNLNVTRPASNGLPFLLAAGDGFVLTPGGLFVLADPSAAGIAVTAGTADLINVANPGGSPCTYDVFIIGA